MTRGGRDGGRSRWRRPGPSRSGHRREHRPGRERTSRQVREARLLEDLAVYRCVALGDIVRERFDGHPYAARRVVDDLKRQGLVGEFKARGPKGGQFRMLHLKSAGLRRVLSSTDLRGVTGRRGFWLDPDQRYWHGRVKAREAAHEAGVYRAGREECRKIRAGGGRVTRIMTDSELKAEVAKAVEKERARTAGWRAALEAAKRKVARDLELPVKDGKVMYPDLVIEWQGEDGRFWRVNVEVATGNYREKDIAAKAAAGFRMHAADGKAARMLAGVGKGSRMPGIREGGGGGRPRDDEGIFEL